MTLSSASETVESGIPGTPASEYYLQEACHSEFDQRLHETQCKARIARGLEFGMRTDLEASRSATSGSQAAHTIPRWWLCQPAVCDEPCVPQLPLGTKPNIWYTSHPSRPDALVTSSMVPRCVPRINVKVMTLHDYLLWTRRLKHTGNIH